MSEERAPYHAGESASKLQKVISEAIRLPDGSRIGIIVDVPEGEDTHLAMSVYDLLLEVLRQFEPFDQSEEL